jgi:hypothetical protein
MPLSGAIAAYAHSQSSAAPLSLAVSHFQRKMVKSRAWTKTEEIACVKAFVIVSEETNQFKSAEFMAAIYFVFRKFGKENHCDEFDMPGLRPCHSEQSIFQRYKGLKAEGTRFGECIKGILGRILPGNHGMRSTFE